MILSGILKVLEASQGLPQAFLEPFGARKRQKIAPHVLQSIYDAETEADFVRMAREQLAEGLSSRFRVDFGPKCCGKGLFVHLRRLSNKP